MMGGYAAIGGAYAAYAPIETPEMRRRREADAHRRQVLRRLKRERPRRPAPAAAAWPEREPLPEAALAPRAAATATVSLLRCDDRGAAARALKRRLGRLLEANPRLAGCMRRRRRRGAYLEYERAPAAAAAPAAGGPPRVSFEAPAVEMERAAPFFAMRRDLRLPSDLRRLPLGDLQGLAAGVGGDGEPLLAAALLPWGDGEAPAAAGTGEPAEAGRESPGEGQDFALVLAVASAPFGGPAAHLEMLEMLVHLHLHELHGAAGCP